MRRCIFTLMVPCGGKVDATILIARGPMTPAEVVSSVSHRHAGDRF